MRTRIPIVALFLIVLPTVADADLTNGQGVISGLVIVGLDEGQPVEVYLRPSDEGKSWSTEAFFSADLFGEYFYAGLLGLAQVGTEEINQVGSFNVRGHGDPYISLQFEFTNTGASPIAVSLFPVLEMQPSEFDSLSRVASQLSVEYIDHDGSGGIDATVRHQFFPQTENLGGFRAQSLELVITDGGKFESSVGPDALDPPDFPPPPYVKMSTILSVDNLMPGDSVIVTGRSDLFAVPEPSSLALVLLGTCVFAFGFFFQRRRTVCCAQSVRNLSLADRCGRSYSGR